MTPDLFFVCDVKSIGLHGEAFAAGWVVTSRDGEMLDENRLACDPGMCKGTDVDRREVAAEYPALTVNCSTPRVLRDDFWAAWRSWRMRRAVMVADFPWPVEANFLAACVQDDPKNRNFGGPIPFIDLASMRIVKGLDMIAAFADRREDETPRRDPLADARRTARQLLELLNT
jgi:hypothetical protein